MLLTLAIIIIILWALGLFAFHVTSGLIHILLVIGVIVLIVHFVRGRSAVWPSTSARMSLSNCKASSSISSGLGEGSFKRWRSRCC